LASAKNDFLIPPAGGEHMTWLSIGIGVASFALLWRVCRRWRRDGTEAAEVALRALGGAGLAGLAALSLDASVVAAAVAAVAAVVLAIDVRGVAWTLTARVRRHASTATPFHNAT
jgi:NO-binding membrane sensor protein with MHYT domain